MEILNKRLVELLSFDGLSFTLDNNVPIYLHNLLSLPVDSKDSKKVTINKLGDHYLKLLAEEENKSGGFSAQPSNELSILEDKVKILKDIKAYKLELERDKYKKAEESIKRNEEKDVIKEILSKRKFKSLEDLTDEQLLELYNK